MSEHPARNPADTNFQQRVRFDPTINLGHILTFIGLLIAGAGGWMAMDKRVTVLETGTSFQRALDARQDVDLQEMKLAVRSDLRDISAKLDRLIEKNGK